MKQFSLQRFFLILSLLLIPLFGFLFWHLSLPDTLTTFTESYQSLGTALEADLTALNTLPLVEDKETFTLTDTSTAGIDIEFANQEKKETPSPTLSLSFPKDYSQPLTVKLTEERTITITDLSGKEGYTADTLLKTNPTLSARLPTSWWERLRGGASSPPRTNLSPLYLTRSTQDPPLCLSSR